MKDKIYELFKNPKLRELAKKLFNKKTIAAAVVVLVLAAALKIAFSLMFEVEGTVTKVNGSKITVANFITTKTVDIGVFQDSTNSIQIGDRIKIMKNISGDVINVMDRSRENDGYRNEKGYDRHGNKDQRGYDSRDK